MADATADLRKFMTCGVGFARQRTALRGLLIIEDCFLMRFANRHGVEIVEDPARTPAYSGIRRAQ